MIEERRKRHENELHEKYLQLYHNEQCYEELMQMLEEAYQNRPAELRRLDSRREKEPNWYRNRNMLGITMYPKLFAGGLNGVIEHLDYLSEQKITYLHLMPLLKMPHPYNDGGYAVEDFKQVDPEIGTNEELEKLTKELRKRGISLCLDVVMNHTADTHEWAIRAKRGEQEYMDRYQCYETREIPDQFEKTMPQVFPETAPGNFTWCEEMHRHVLTTFYPYQWDLNYHNPKVFNEMIGNILYLANMGVEVFRIDAVPYIWKELGTNCRNLPQVHLIVRMLRMILEMICPAVILKGEVVMEPKELPVYFGTESEPECHMLYGVSSMVNLWAALATRDTRMLKHQMDVIHSLPKNCYFVNYLRCHDDIGWGLDEEQEKKLEINPIRHKEYLYHFFEGTYPYSFARGELYNYDPVTKDVDYDRAQIKIALGTWDYRTYGGTSNCPVQVNTTDVSTFVDFNTDISTIAYGSLILQGDASNSTNVWQQITIPLDYKDQTAYPSYIIISCAASMLGDYFTGSEESELWVDGMELLYE